MAGYRYCSVLALCLVLLASPGVQVSSEKVWAIAIGSSAGAEWGAVEYRDEDGYLTGFHKEFIAEVCAAAGIQCRIMFMPFNWCWDSSIHTHSVPGKGLIGGWVDGCAGWRPSVERIHVFDFGLPYLEPDKSHFYTKPGSTFDPEDLTNKRIEFLDGNVSDEKCVARQSGSVGSFLETSQVHYSKTLDEFVGRIVSGEADAGLTISTAMDAYLDQVVTDKSHYYVCGLGNSIMTRKDNGLITHWNRGYQKLRNTGKFMELCKKSTEKHGHRGALLCL